MTINKALDLSGFVVCMIATSADADPTCNKASQDTWIPFEQAKHQVMDQGYSIKKFKTTDTGCYELYGKDAQGKRVEIYYDPTNLKVVKEEKDD